MSTIDDLRSATFAAQSYDATIAEAYASSPLGDPEIEDGSVSEPAKFEDFPPTTVIATPPAEPRSSWRTNAAVGAAVIAAIGTVAWLGVLLLDGTGSKQEKPAVVAPNSSVGSVIPQAPSAVPPSPVAPAPPSVATPPIPTPAPAPPRQSGGGQQGGGYSGGGKQGGGNPGAGHPVPVRGGPGNCIPWYRPPVPGKK
jgi:hypothetical protein